MADDTYKSRDLTDEERLAAADSSRSEVGRRLRDARRDRGLSLKEAAELASAVAGRPIHFTTIGKIETGKTQSAHRYFEILEEAYGLNKYELALKNLAGAYPRTFPVYFKYVKNRYKPSDEPQGTISSPAGGPNSMAFIVTDIQISQLAMDMDGGYVVVDPDDRELIAGRHYLIRRPNRDTFVRFSKQQMAFFPLSPTSHQDPESIPLGREPIEVLGRVVFIGIRPDDDVDYDVAFAMKNGPFEDEG